MKRGRTSASSARKFEEITQLLAEGLSYTEIAERCGCLASTVSAQATWIRSSTGAPWHFSIVDVAKRFLAQNNGGGV